MAVCSEIGSEYGVDELDCKDDCVGTVERALDASEDDCVVPTGRAYDVGTALRDDDWVAEGVALFNCVLYCSVALTGRAYDVGTVVCGDCIGDPDSVWSKTGVTYAAAPLLPWKFEGS